MYRQVLRDKHAHKVAQDRAEIAHRLDHADANLARIALDKEITIMLSQGESAAPLCGIYFNLNSPYSREDGGRNITQTGVKAEAKPPN